MRSVQQLMWRSALLLFLTQLVQWGMAQVLVQVQSGPLYRVIGYSLSISCNVSGFSNVEAEQDLEFSFYKPTNPNREINIISTSDPDFAFAIYGMRVRNGDITLERLSATSALFHIKVLQDKDEGEYECSSPNSEDVYHGMYSAKTTVKVIEDTLTASTMNPPAMTLPEGDALSLQCHASSNTLQHTHLSVTWYLHRKGESSPSPIISLDRDLIVSPGERFSDRYQAGLIGLDKVGESLYRMRMAQLEVSDAGLIYCQAQEWIQDPDRSWYAIAQKDAAKTSLEVKAKVVAPKQGSLAVRISAQQAELKEGEELALRCIVEVQGRPSSFFSLAWLRDRQELARIGPTGVLAVGPEYSGRHSGGELRAMRIGEREHLLTLRPIRAVDQGEYLCRVWAEEGDGNGVFTKGTSMDSVIQTIRVSATQSGLSVVMEAKNVSINEGGKLELTCRVTGVKGHLSVIWQRRSGASATSPLIDVISLSQEGVMEIGDTFGQRGVRALRPTANDFTLELSDMSPEDAALYQCTVSEWTTETNGNVKKTHSQSQDSKVAVTPVESILKVKLFSRDILVTVGDSADLVCQVKGPHHPITVTWSLRRDGASSVDTLLTVAHNNDIRWSGDQSNYQLRSTRVSETVVQHLLRIDRASFRQAGQYQCVISALMQKSQWKKLESNLLGVKVIRPVSKLSLTVSPAHQEQLINTDVQMICSAPSVTSDSARLAIDWFVETESSGNQSLLLSDRNGVITAGTWAGTGAGQRISMSRVKERSFELTIRQVRIGDNGRYVCKVEEWLQEPNNQWYALPPAFAVAQLQVREKVSDFSVNKTDLQLQAKEGQEVALNCALTSGASDPTHIYALEWFYTPPSAARVPLVVRERSGVTRYQGSLQGPRMLRLSRPSQDSFRLEWRQAAREDGGAYACKVEQYQLSHQGDWELRASDTSGTTRLTVQPIESNLRVLKRNHHLNLTAMPATFNVSCDITSRTSQSSELQVTWYWRTAAEGELKRPLPFFRAHRNLTLQDLTGRGPRLRFGRPSPSLYTLAVTMATPSDSGVYHCEVEEWLQSPSLTWRRVAQGTSGNLSVHIQMEEDVEPVSEPACLAGTTLGIAIPLLCLLVLVIIVLTCRLKKGPAMNKKQDNSLWAQATPLKTLPIEGE